TPGTPGAQGPTGPTGASSSVRALYLLNIQQGAIGTSGIGLLMNPPFSSSSYASFYYLFNDNPNNALISVTFTKVNGNSNSPVTVSLALSKQPTRVDSNMLPDPSHPGYLILNNTITIITGSTVTYTVDPTVGGAQPNVATDDYFDTGGRMYINIQWSS